LIPNHFCDTVSGSEKAGVGGSISSLATIKFNHSETQAKPFEVAVHVCSLILKSPEQEETGRHSHGTKEKVMRPPHR